MEKYLLTYDVIDGCINDWLILGPIITPLDLPTNMDREANFIKALNASFFPWEKLPDLFPTQLDKIDHNGKELFWKLEHCKPDHRIDASLFSGKRAYVQLWAYCCLVSPVQGQYLASLNTDCAGTIWINGQKIFCHEDAGSAGKYDRKDEPVELPLVSGENHVWLLLEKVSMNETFLSGRLRLPGDTPQLKVAIPVLSRDLDYWKTIEGIYAKLSINRAVYTSADPIVLNCPVGLPWSPHVITRIRTPSGRIYGEFSRELKAGEISLGVSGSHFPSGDLEVLVMPPAEDYYQKHFRVSRSIPFQVANEKYSSQEEIPYEQRLAALLRKAAGRDGLAAEYARLKLAWSSQVDPKIFEKAIHRIGAHESGVTSDLLGLLAVASCLAEQNQNIPAEIGQAILNASLDRSENDASTVEMEQLYSAACRILAGQLFPDSLFSVPGLSGKEERTRGERQAVEWLQKHAWYGFLGWNPDLNALIPPLVFLAEYGENEQVSELATVLLDKLLYLFALTSWKGCPLPIGSKVSTAQLKSERFHPSASLGMLLWGQGNINEKVDGAAYLGLSNGYSLPEIIRSIAQDQDSTVWAAQKDGAVETPGDGVMQVVYKTPDYLLASAQIHSKGEPGQFEHLWQAVLGTEAVVFSNLPGSYSQSDFRPAGYWRGNSVMPHLVQWGDSLVCIYSPDDLYPLGFSHAYFPLYAFDEYRIEMNWAFARKEDGYIALYARNGLELVTEGDDAFRELRSYGDQNIWCCQMGRKSEDAGFEDFCQKNRSCSPEIRDLTVTWRTIRKDNIVFAWNSKPQINGDKLHLLENRQVESPFGEAPQPATYLDIQYQGNRLRLDFS